MSYLSPIRLHFSGQFQADPSTVNNDVRHFNNDTFMPQFQQPQSGPLLNGWWEPDGGGAWRIVGCNVTMVGYADGTTSTSDPIVGFQIADANARVAGKIVDLDPQQQMVSEIWGLIVRLTDGTTDYFSGHFEVSPFTDIWFRAPATGGDLTMGAFWQSVIGPVTWNDTSSSQFLEQLSAGAPDGMLSIKMNVDGYQMDPTNPNFTLGRLTGTIGPAPANQPKRFVLGRQLLPAQGSPMNFMQAVVDKENKAILADFGNALPTTSSGGPLRPIGKIELGYLDSGNAFQSIGELQYQSPGWYTNTAGVQAFPLSDAQLNALKSSRVAVAQNGNVIVRENIDGLYARADQFVFRMNPGTDTAATADVDIWSAQYGEPLPNAAMVANFFPSGLQAGGSGLPDGLGPTPPFGTPTTDSDGNPIISFPTSFSTGSDGRAKFTITANDPGNPRTYVDGQVYGILYLLAAIAKQVKNDPSLMNPSDFVSLLVHDAYAVPEHPTWYDLLPIWQQYANLYPIMARIVNLASYEDVLANQQILSFAFALPAGDPNHMPVTRDLSDAKREAILKFLADPRRGEPPVKPTPPLVRFVARKGGPPPKPPARSGTADPRDGGKTFAMSQRPPFTLPDFDL